MSFDVTSALVFMAVRYIHWHGNDVKGTRSRTPYSERETEMRDDGQRCAGNNGRRGVKREKQKEMVLCWCLKGRNAGNNGRPASVSSQALDLGAPEENSVKKAVGAPEEVMLTELEKEPKGKCYKKTVGEEATFMETAKDIFTQFKENAAKAH
jgi:hypothetical protein